MAGGEAFWGEVNLAGEEATCGLLATAVEIGHSKLLLELVNKNLGFEIKQKARRP